MISLKGLILLIAIGSAQEGKKAKHSTLFRRIYLIA